MLKMKNLRFRGRYTKLRNLERKMVAIGLVFRSLFRKKHRCLGEQTYIDELKANVQDTTSEDFLKTIANQCGYEEIREIALSRLNDPEAIKHVAMFSNFKDTRIAAVNKINYQEMLEWIAIFAEHPDSRKTAIDRITDSETMIRVINGSIEHDSRKRAKRRIKKLN